MATALVPEAYQFALENTVDSVVITDTSSVIQYVNPAFTSTTGFTPEEAVGNKPSILRSCHTTRETYEAMWETILAGGWWRGEIINVTKQGEEWYSYLSISQIRGKDGEAMAYVGIARDVTERHRLEQQLREANLEAIYMLSVACEAKDEVTGSHVRRVQHYSEQLALQLGLSPEEAREIGYSSMMHDVGKLQVPDKILKKPGPLSDTEWLEMVQHPKNGAAILRDKPFFQTARAIAAHHHEKWNGTGYPDGLASNDIPLAARIVSVADVFDALTTTRPYKDAWPEVRALAELQRLRGIAFDAKVVDAFSALHKAGAIGEIRRMFPPED